MVLLAAGNFGGAVEDAVGGAVAAQAHFLDPQWAGQKAMAEVATMQCLLANPEGQALDPVQRSSPHGNNKQG